MAEPVQNASPSRPISNPITATNNPIATKDIATPLASANGSGAAFAPRDSEYNRHQGQYSERKRRERAGEQRQTEGISHGGASDRLRKQRVMTAGSVWPTARAVSTPPLKTTSVLWERALNAATTGFCV